MSFGIDHCFEARIESDIVYIVCGGGTGYATSVLKGETLKGIIEPIRFCNEQGVINFCSLNKWSYYDYYNHKIFN